MAWSLTRNILLVLNILFLSFSYFSKVNLEFQSDLQGKYRLEWDGFITTHFYFYVPSYFYLSMSRREWYNDWELLLNVCLYDTEKIYISLLKMINGFYSDN